MALPIQIALFATWSVIRFISLFLCLKALFMMLLIQDLSKSCRMEVYRVEKSNV